MNNILSKVKKILNPILFLGLAFVIFSSPARAADNFSSNSGLVFTNLLFILTLLLVSKIASLIKKIHLPAVVGELLAGMALGNLSLIGINFFETNYKNPAVNLIAQIGLIFLLFEIGLESNLSKVKTIFKKTATLGILSAIIPFFLGFLASYLIIFADKSLLVHLIIGTALGATSIGITARVFKELGISDSKESFLVITSAVFDDIISLILLSVIVSFAQTGQVSLPGTITVMLKSFAFLLSVTVIGQIIAPQISIWFSKISQGTGIKISLVVSFALFGAYIAHLAGLASIIGAFAIGLALDPVIFREFEDPKIVKKIQKILINGNQSMKKQKNVIDALEKFANKHIEELIRPFRFVFTPIFFITTAMNIKLGDILSFFVLRNALVLILLVIAGELMVASLFKGYKRLVIGFGLISRGEVTIIIAAFASSMKLITNQMFSSLILVVIITSTITPLTLAYLLKDQKA